MYSVDFPSFSLTLFLVVHTFLSLLLAFFAANSIKKRYVQSGEDVERADERRLLEAKERHSLLYLLLFKVSLHRNNFLVSFFWFFLYTFCLPIIGYFSTLWVTRYLANVEYEIKQIKTGIINLDEFNISFLQVQRIFGEGAMTTTILNPDIPRSKRLKALSALAAQITPLTLKIIEQTLSSPDDEIRLYGYSIINKIEKRLNDDISKYLQIYRESDDKKEQKYIAAKELAFLYWEYIYTELADESLTKSFLKEVEKYLFESKNYFLHRVQTLKEEIEELENTLEALQTKESIITKEDLTQIKSLREKIKESYLQEKHYKNTASNLFVLSGKLYMKKSIYDKALTEFTIAQELSENDSSFVIPYLAEIYYIFRKFHIVKSLFQNTPMLALNPKLYPIVLQWRGER